MNKFIIILTGLLSVASYGQSNGKEIGISDPGEELSYSTPSELGLDSLYIYSKVDSIMKAGIRQTAFPGAQLLVAKKGKIIFHEAYGFHTYDSVQAVALNDIYDLASVTKIAGPLPALMKLVDEGILNLDVPFSTYWKSWKGRKDKKDLTLREILAHQAGLEPYIVFLNKVMKKDRLKKRFIQNTRSNRFQKQAYEGIYVKNKFVNKMHRMIRRSDVSADKKYRYSGLTFLIFPQLIEQLTGIPYDQYLRETFYDPLGCRTMGFNPDKWQVTNKVVPTEYDSLYRKTLTHGWVHDENASLLGGISGNAGLFATAIDLAKLMQLYQNYGSLNGKRFITEKTVKEFTEVQFPENDNRRGLGFDKPLPNNSELSISEAYPAPAASPYSFGHSGFTGTFVWSDPEYQLVFIFLSNRVHPSRNSRKLYSLNIRTALHQVFYQAEMDQN
jgi:CubicO group peptidase (beta-lactamase class C family)